MNGFLSRLGEVVAVHLTAAGRDRARLVRQAEVEAMVAADRMHMARLLATVGEYHIGLAELNRYGSGTDAPEVADRRRWVLDSLAAAIRDELDGFTQRRSEWPR
jgi:hypothetical protein